MTRAWTKTALAIGVVAFASACAPAGSGPEFGPVDDQVAYVGEEHLIELRATDPDGSALAYSLRSNLPTLRERADLTQIPGGAVFSFSPTADDVGEWYIDFYVTDGNFDDRATIEFFIEHPPGEPPTFVRPTSSGRALDVSEENAQIALDIEVHAPAAGDVEIFEEPPTIEGAEFEQTSGLEATWNWTPSDAQIAASDQYEVVLIADDGVNPPTTKTYLIVLEGRESAHAVRVAGGGDADVGRAGIAERGEIEVIDLALGAHESLSLEVRPPASGPLGSHRVVLHGDDDRVREMTRRWPGTEGAERERFLYTETDPGCGPCRYRLEIEGHAAADTAYAFRIDRQDPR